MDRLTKAQMEFMNGYIPVTIDDVYNYQQGGVAQGDQGNDQMMQMIQTYAQMIAQQSGEDPNKVYQELMGQLQQMKPEQQQAAMQEIVKQVQTVSQQPTMQMGGNPSQMQQAPQQQGADAEQLIQQIQQMLQQGAQPQEVIAQLLQLQIDPQMIVEIFVQLGMPQEQVVPAVQEVMQQMSAGQEQEVLQEPMQEEAMEEPVQQGMEYGGVAKYPYGGMYGNKKYYGNFLPQDALNNIMTDVNMLAPGAAALSASGIKPLKQIAGIAGLASGLAGAFQGYRGAANALFGKKNKVATSNDDTSYSVTGNTPSTFNPMTSSPRIGPQRFEDLSEKDQKFRGIPYLQNDNSSYNVTGNNGQPITGIPSSMRQQTDYNADTQAVQDSQLQKRFPRLGPTPEQQRQSMFGEQSKYDALRNLRFKYGGDLYKAQFGIPEGFDFSNPFGFNKNNFGQTANYADTRGYTNGQPTRDRSTRGYSTPGFVEGMGVGQEGYSEVNNSMNTNAFPQPSMKAFPKPPMVDEEPQAPDLTGLYPQLSKRQQRKQDKADFAYNRKQSDAIIEDTTDNKTYKLKKSVLNNNGTVNKKTANNISGRQMANNALLGLSLFNDSLGDSGPRALSKAQLNQQREASMLYNPINTTGVYTSNVQGGGNDYIPNRYTAIQDYGTQGNIARAGGQMNFAAGEQYKVSHDQLLQLLRDGAEIEFL